jgi:hypothetical protein
MIRRASSIAPFASRTSGHSRPRRDEATQSECSISAHENATKLVVTR